MTWFPPQRCLHGSWATWIGRSSCTWQSKNVRLDFCWRLWPSEESGVLLSVSAFVSVCLCPRILWRLWPSKESGVLLSIGKARSSDSHILKETQISNLLIVVTSFIIIITILIITVILLLILSESEFAFDHHIHNFHRKLPHTWHHFYHCRHHHHVHLVFDQLLVKEDRRLCVVGLDAPDVVRLLIKFSSFLRQPWQCWRWRCRSSPWSGWSSWGRAWSSWRGFRRWAASLLFSWCAPPPLATCLGAPGRRQHGHHHHQQQHHQHHHHQRNHHHQQQYHQHHHHQRNHHHQQQHHYFDQYRILGVEEESLEVLEQSVPVLLDEAVDVVDHVPRVVLHLCSD